MKIAILSYYSGTHERGVETWADNLSRHLSSQFKVDIFSGLDSYLFWKWLNYEIVIPTNGRLQTVIARIFCWLTGKKLIIFGHSGPGADDKWNLLCSPDIFVTFSHWQKSWADKFKFSWTKTVVIPHAVDTSVFKPAKNKPGKNVVLCVAANTPNKRVDLVAQAVSGIPGAKFVAVGRGNDIQVPYSQIPKIYQQADVFCFVPQPWEAFGLVFLETLASNLPVVTIDDPVRREIVGDAGVFVKNPENIKELSQAIRIAISKDWKDKPREQAMYFSWEKITPQYLKFFEL